MLEVSKSYPNQLVNALRIISREEAYFCRIFFLLFLLNSSSLDEYWIKKKEETGFAPSDRPKKWKDECKETIRQTIETK